MQRYLNEDTIVSLESNTDFWWWIMKDGQAIAAGYERYEDVKPYLDNTDELAVFLLRNDNSVSYDPCSKKLISQ